MKKRLFLISCLFILCAAFPVVSAEDKAGDKYGSDIILLMDSSGSMKQTDPRNYRKPAARLFVSLLGESDRIGVISFGDSAKVLAPLTQNTKKNRAALFEAINKVTSKEFSTNITDAVKKGFEGLKSSKAKNSIIVLMSDGRLALGSKEKDEAAFAELKKIMPELVKSGIKLYSVAFTEMSDMKLLEDMAKETGGFFRFAKEDKDIHAIFTSLFEKMKSPDAVPLEGDSFAVDENIAEAILVITKQAGTATSLIDPSNRKHTPAQYGKNLQWYESKVFDMITIKAPAPGKWKVKLSTTQGNKVFVITNLSLKSSFDKGFVNRGDKIKIDAWLEKDGGALKEKDVLTQVSFFADIAGSDGKSSRVAMQAEADGRYYAEVIVNNVGEYTAKISAESRTFKREKVLAFKAVATPQQKAMPQPHLPAKKPDSSWKEILIKFGIINAAVVCAFAVIYLARKIAAKAKTKVRNKEGKGKK
jgi:hypothetical protein